MLASSRSKCMHSRRSVCMCGLARSWALLVVSKRESGAADLSSKGLA